MSSMARALPTGASDAIGAGAGVVAAVEGIGAFVPAGIIDNRDLEELVDTSDEWILERTGIRQRRRVGAGETTSTMGAAAARRALARAGDPEVDLVIVATVTPDTLFPSAACLIQRRLGLEGVPAMDVNAACSGFMYALTLADALIRAGRNRRVLVVAAEAMTTLVDYGDRQTCVLFGDGAGAAVVGAAGEGGIAATRWGAEGRESDLIYYGPAGGDDASADPAIRMAGRGTYRIAVERLTDLAVGLCEDAGWTLDEVDHVVPHQANLRIVEAAARRAEVPMHKVTFNGDRFGNTSAASIPLALAEADAAGRLRRGDRVVCVAFGAGSTWGGVALEWTMGPPA